MQEFSIKTRIVYIWQVWAKWLHTMVSCALIGNLFLADQVQVFTLKLTFLI